MVEQGAGQAIGGQQSQLLTANQVEDQVVGIAATAEQGRQPLGRLELGLPEPELGRQFEHDGQDSRVVTPGQAGQPRPVSGPEGAGAAVCRDSAVVRVEEKGRLGRFHSEGQTQARR